MALAETANLVVKLSLAGNFNRQLTTAQRGLGRLDAALSKSEGRAYRAGQQIGTGIKNAAKIAAVGIGILASQVVVGLNSLIKLEEATAQTEAVIKSTGGAAGVTAEKVRQLAEKYEALNATVGDETIQSGQNLLLTFTAIKDQAFEPALEAALNLSTALGTDLDTAIRTVGKALSEPEKAMTRLRRQGIILTDAEEKQVKAHLKNNDALGAQKVILEALDTRYGGSFLAKGDTTAGKVAKFTDSIEDLQRALATALLPAVGNIADALTELLSDPEVIKGAEQLGRDIGRIFSKDNIKEGARLVGQVFDTLRKAAPAIKTALSGVGTVLKGAFDAFTSLPPEVQQLLIGGFAVNKLTGGLVTNIAGGVFGALKAMTVQAGVVNVTGGVVNGGGVGAAAGAGKMGGVAGAATKVLSVAAIVAGVAAVIETQQEQSGMNTGIATGIREGLNSSIAGKSLPELRTAMSAVDTGIRDLQANPLHMLVQGDALTQLQGMRADLATQIARVEALKTQADRTKDDTITATGKVTQRVNETKRETSRGLTQVKATAKAGLAETKRETSRGTSIISATQRSGTSQVVGAIRSNRPVVTTIVNVSATHVSKTVNVNRRYGRTDSRSQSYGQGLGQFGQ